MGIKQVFCAHLAIDATLLVDGIEFGRAKVACNWFKRHLLALYNYPWYHT